MSKQASAVAIEALGVPIDIAVSGSLASDAAAAVGHAWSGALRDVGDAELVLRVSVGESDGEADLTLDEVDTALHLVSQAVTQVAIQARAGELMMLHAAGLCHPTTGATVALIAPSGTGKTTACRLLGRAYGYVTDEAVGFDRALTVFPYRKPLSVVAASGNIKQQLSPHSADLLPAHPSPSLAGLVFIERDETVRGVEMQEVRAAAAIPMLAAQTSYLAHHERPLGFLADALERTGGLRVVRYREAEDLAVVIEKLVEARR